MSNKAELQAALDDIADRTSGIVFLPASGGLDAVRRAAWRQCKGAPEAVQHEIDRAIDAACVLKAVLRLEGVEVRWV